MNKAALLSIHKPVISPVRVHEAVSKWEAVQEVLRPSVEASADARDNMAAVMQDITTGAAVLHKIEIGVKAKALFVTYVRQRKDGLALHVWQMAGDDMADWIDPFIEYLDDWAGIWDCDLITFGGRQGWQKALIHQGFKTESVAMVKRVGA